MKHWIRYDLTMPISILSIFLLSYLKYPFTSNLLMLILASGIEIFEWVKAIRQKTFVLDPTPLKPLDAIRRIVFAFAQTLFVAYIATSTVLGGRAISDDFAQSNFEGYSAGTFYLATRTTLTEVSQGTWMFMHVFESVAIPLVIVSVLGNVLYVGLTKGWKSVIHPY